MTTKQQDFWITDEERASDVSAEMKAMKDVMKCEVAQYMRDICIDNMMAENDAAAAALWRRKGEAWEHVRDAYALRAHGQSEQDFLCI